MEGSVRIEYRFGGGDTNRIRMHAANLVAMKPDVIFAMVSKPSVNHA